MPRVGQAAVIAVDHLAHQPEIVAQPAAVRRQRRQEIRRDHVGRIQAQPVDLEILHPAAHRLEEVGAHVGVGQVELDQVVMPAPALIAKGSPYGLRAAKIQTPWNQPA